MTLAPVSFQPFMYMYNTNRISASSMDKVQPVKNEPAKSMTDFSGMTSQQNENPLKMGQSKNFMDIISSQMQMSRANEARIMKASDATQPLDVFKDKNAFQVTQPQMVPPADDMMNVMDDMIVNAL